MLKKAVRWWMRAGLIWGGGCALAGAEAPVGEAVEILGRARVSFYQNLEDRAPRREVIRSQAEFEQVFPEESRRAFILRELEVESVDFEKEMLLWATSELKSTGGFTLSVVEVRRAGEGLRVRLRETAPQGMTTMAFTKPGELVRIPRIEGKIDWVR